jgi:hypothetical protein
LSGEIPTPRREFLMLTEWSQLLASRLATPSFQRTTRRPKAEALLLEMPTSKLQFLAADSTFVAKADSFPDHS